MLITIGKRIVYAIIICVALLFIALGSMWCLSSHYKTLWCSRFKLSSS